jgi:hypothetical protein
VPGEGRRERGKKKGGGASPPTPGSHLRPHTLTRPPTPPLPSSSQAPLPSKPMQDYIAQVRARVAACPNFFYFTAQ